MNQVDTTTGRRDVTLGLAPAHGEPRPVPALSEGDIIAMPFAGYGDILCEITEFDLAAGDGDVQTVVASDGEYSYTAHLDRASSVLVYPATMKGAVLR